MEMKKITDTTAKIVDLLEPLDDSERTRVIQAAQTLLGKPLTPGINFPHTPLDPESENDSTLKPQVKHWMQQNDIKTEQIQQVFQIDSEGIEVIAGKMPGKNAKAQTINAYIIEGIRTFILTGDRAGKFDDKSARALCKNLAVLNEANHASYMKEKINELAGGKDAGWKLTAPGLIRGAVLIKEMTN